MAIDRQHAVPRDFCNREVRWDCRDRSPDELLRYPGLTPSRMSQELMLATASRQRLSLHPTISSAVASSTGGIARPRLRAVLRLIASSNLIGACTGNSDTLSPCRTRSAYPAARR